MRVVSLVPSITELLSDLGLDHEVVGLTRFCVRPEGWKARKTVVGGTKHLNLDRIADLKPGLILANKEENVREQVEALARFAEVHVTDVSTVEEGIRMISEIGTHVDRPDAASRLADEIRQRFAALKDQDSIPAAYLIWRDPYMVAGGDTFISDVMARGGYRNVFAHRERYPAVTPGEIADAGARVVLLSSEPYPFAERHAGEIETSVPGVECLLVDGQMFSWYGSRMLHMPAYLAALRR